MIEIALEAFVPEEAALGPAASLVLPLIATAFGVAFTTTTLGPLSPPLGSFLNVATSLTQATLVADGTANCVTSQSSAAIGVLKAFLQFGVIFALIVALASGVARGVGVDLAFVFAIIGLILTFAGLSIGPISLGFVTFSVSVSAIFSLLAVVAVTLALAIPAFKASYVSGSQLALLAALGLAGILILGLDISQSDSC